MTNESELDDLIWFFVRHRNIEKKAGWDLAGLLFVDFPKAEACGEGKPPDVTDTIMTQLGGGLRTGRYFPIA